MTAASSGDKGGRGLRSTSWPSSSRWRARTAGGYTRIKGALKNLGHEVGLNTIKRILQENGVDPAPEPEKRMSWATFIKAHLGVIVGMDFFTVEAMTWLGLVRYHVLFAIDIASRKVEILGIAVNPGGSWMEQMARNLVDAIDGFLLGKRYLLSTGIHCTHKLFDESSTKLASRQ
jgi:hypothetical protein